MGGSETLLVCSLYPWESFAVVFCLGSPDINQYSVQVVYFKSSVSLNSFLRRPKGSIFASISQAAIGVLLIPSQMSLTAWFWTLSRDSVGALEAVVSSGRA